MDENDLEKLHLFHPKLRPYIKVLITHEFGLLKDLPKIHSIQCGSIVKMNEIQYGDRFQLRILYCRKPLNWHVLMNGNDLGKAPDFVMEDNFLADLKPDTVKSKLPSLVNWCPSNVKCLLNVVLELLDLYKNYNINQLRASSDLQRYLFEYDTLMSMTELESDEIEVYVQNTIRTPAVTFLIRLKMDFSKLPIALPKCKDLIVLIIEFKDNSKNIIQLIPRVELEDAFGSPLAIPDLSPDVSLMDYVPVLQDSLQKKIEKMAEFLHQRKIFYSSLLQIFEPSLINGDNVNFENVSFLLEHDGFFCVLNIRIPLDYPENHPALHLFTLHKTKNIRSSEFNGYKFNKSMSHEEVATSIYSFVKEKAIVEFQEHVISLNQ